MLSILLTSILFCAFVTLFINTCRRHKCTYKLPPALSGELPIIGHTHFLLCDTKGLWRFAQRIAKECVKKGGVIYSRFGTYTYYIITDPEDALTASNACLQKHYAYDFAKNWLGDGLVTGSGEIHKRHRRLLGPGFSPSVIYGYLQQFNYQTRKMIKDLQPYVDQGSFDPTVMIKSMVLEISCLTTFGSQTNDKNFLQNYMKAIDSILNIITQRFQKFYLNNHILFKLLGYKKKEDLLLDSLNTMSNAIIKERKAAMKKMNESPNKDMVTRNETFLDHLLSLSLEGLLTDKEIKEEVATNIAASFETVAHALLNILVLVGTYTEVQDKLYEEAIKVLGQDRDINKEDVQKLVYTKAVIKEALRMIPTAPVVLRYVDKEVKLKNYTMPADSQCLLFFLGMHNNAEWGPDVAEFKPERWLNAALSTVNGNNFGGFSIGKRSCLGVTYALTILSVVLMHMVRHYQWTADVSNMEIKLDVTAKAWKGHEISIRRRNN